MTTKKWNQLTNDEELDRLTAVLTLARSNIKFRDREGRQRADLHPAYSLEAGPG